MGNIPEIKSGYIVEINHDCESEQPHLCMVVNTKRGLTISGEGYWNDLSDFNEKLIYEGFDRRINKIYDRSPYNSNCHKIEVHSRKLLWERPTTKKMTIQEIINELGYNVEIVK